MKVVSNLIRETLITAQEVQKIRAKSEGIDLTRIANNIIVAEERFIRTALGSDLYDELVAAKNTTVTSGNQAELQEAIRKEWNDASLVLSVGDIINDESSLSEMQRKLWRMYLWQVVAECVWFVAFPENYTDLTSAGLVHNVPKFSGFQESGNSKTTPSQKTLEFQMDKILTGRIAPLLENMHAWLCVNKESFPTYKKDCGDCNTNGKITGSGPVFIDIYGEEEDTCGCD